MQKSLDIIESRYSPTSWNIYTFHCSDGENWDEDNPKALKCMEKLTDVSQLAGYIQITESQQRIWGEEMAKIFLPLVSDSFKIIKIVKKEDIWEQFCKLFGGKYDI